MTGTTSQPGPLKFSPRIDVPYIVLIVLGEFANVFLNDIEATCITESLYAEELPVNQKNQFYASCEQEIHFFCVKTLQLWSLLS